MPALSETHLNILVVVMLTLIVKTRFSNARPSKHLVCAAKTARWAITIDTVALVALTIGLDMELWWIFGLFAQIAIVMTGCLIAGRFIGTKMRVESGDITFTGNSSPSAATTLCAWAGI